MFLLDSQNFLDFGECARRTEFLVFVGDELRVFGHENLAGRAKVEFFRVVAEVFAVYACPYEASVGVDIDFCDTELCGFRELVLVNAFGAFDISAGLVDPLDFLLRNRAGAVHYEREIREEFLDLFEDVEMKSL